MNIDYKKIQELFEQYRDTSSAASYEEMYRLTYPLMVQVAFSMCGDRYIAEDSTQNMFIRLESYKDKIRDTSYIFCWMSKTTMNYARKALNDNNREVNNVDDGYIESYACLAKSSDPYHHYNYIRDVVYDSMQELSPELRKFVMLRYISGYTAKEIAVLTGYNYRTAVRRLDKALAELKCIVSAKYGSISDILF